MNRSWSWYATNAASLPVIAAWVWIVAKLTGFA